MLPLNLTDFVIFQDHENTVNPMKLCPQQFLPPMQGKSVCNDVKMHVCFHSIEPF